MSTNSNTPNINSKLGVAFKVFMMLFLGTVVTLTIKLMNEQCVENCDDPDVDNHIKFSQPVWQTLMVFCGELFCGIFKLFNLVPNNSEDGKSGESAPLLRKDRKPELKGNYKLLVWFPSTFDLIATILMSMGLLLIPVSVFQMLKGSMVLFVGLLSITLLNRRLGRSQWSGLGSIFAGVIVVGISNSLRSDSLQTSSGKTDILTGVIGILLVISAQLFSALQFVAQEKIMSMFEVDPLDLVWMEGGFGLVTTTIFMLTTHLLMGASRPGSFYDMKIGFFQVINNSNLIIIVIIFSLALGLFNIFGLIVTQSISATSRSTIDVTRTVTVWMVAMGLGWETFQWLQVGGFILIILGSCLFNKLIDFNPKSTSSVPAQAASV
ncbi:hypothetical protein CONCODRAFT_78933 [Conidiobolus coronatus NRRL 28638]|uniref:Integral membrane protein n=1 Tax=Conidiobolus coronatus (strain ATCC 28846 / CBS 209.66 / NRRL 28638) TaxID=796925 RepID=A0A137P5M5_CONC2|nr:hypothetical protein CONCODRAFT_78933 [Conidiobolus coronatus NRRL 28638]|eukprot:KXN70259.1 hypothetical protein CONCODRAFT_78933 [Conidiobolus coronatus NRRL 28638]